MSTDVKIVINVQTWDKPEYVCELDIFNLKIHLKNQQLQDILKLVEYFNIYQYALKVQREKYKLNTTKPDTKQLYNQNIQEYEKRLLVEELWIFCLNLITEENMLKDYIKFLLKILSKPKSSYRQVLSKKETERYHKIIRRTDIGSLQRWTKWALEMKVKKLHKFKNMDKLVQQRDAN